MWRGQRRDHKLRKWFQYIYIAAFNGNPEGDNKIVDHCQHLRFKIGKAQNLRVRGKAIIAESGGEIIGENSTEDNSKKLIKWSNQIVYAFSVPRPLMFETRIKRFLNNFIHKNLDDGGTKVQYASEIVQGIAFEALVHVIQLCILEGCLYHNYIKLNDEEQIFKQYVGAIMNNPPDIIKWKGNTYYGRKGGYHQTMTLTISKNVKTTVSLTLNSKDALKRIKSIQLKDDFDLMKDVVQEDSVNSPGFVQYVFDVQNNDSRMNHIQNPSDSPSKMSYSRKATDAPNNSFGVGNLAFATFEKDGDGRFPCEIVGYWNGQFVIRWIDPRRFDTKARKWIKYDSDAHKRYKKNNTQETLSDFLKDDVVAVGNNYVNDPVTGNRYRDYIQLIETKEDNEYTQPTEVLVPTFYRTVGEEYKNPKQLKTWNANKYGAAFAPSRHWETGNPNGENKPSNPKFRNKTEAELDYLENEVTRDYTEFLKGTAGVIVSKTKKDGLAHADRHESSRPKKEIFKAKSDLSAEEFWKNVEARRSTSDRKSGF